MDTPFADRADGAPELNCALAESRATVLVFGADWCPDARAFAAFLAEPDLAARLEPCARTVLIDVGRHDRNQDLVRRLGLGAKLEGVPAVLVLDAEGTVLNAEDVYRWRTARSADAAAVSAWLDTLLSNRSGDAS